MKIIGGTYRGRNFFMPEGIRPTQNIARKALFDILGQDLAGQSFLDLFAGSGAVGIEAFSRGASPVVVVEKESKCIRVIEENKALLMGKKDEISWRDFHILQQDAFMAVKNLSRSSKKFDIIFADPPYGRGLAKKALKTLGAYDIVHPTSVIIIQHNKNEILPEVEGRICRIRQRKFGSTAVTLYKC